MKKNYKPTTLRRIIQGLLTLSLSIGTSQAVPLYKQDTTTLINATDWTPNQVPTSADICLFQGGVGFGNLAQANALNLTLGGNLNCLNFDLRANGTRTAIVITGSSPNTINLFSSSSGNNQCALDQGNGVLSTIIDAPITLNASAFVRVQGSGDLTVQGSIGETGGARSLTFSGQQSWVSLTGANTYTGGTVMNNGNGNLLVISGSGTLGSPNTGGLTMPSASTSGVFLDLGGTTQSVGTVNLGQACLIQNGTLNSSNFNGGANAYGVFNVNLGGTGALTLNNSGKLSILSGTNTWSGATTVTAGTLLATKPAALPNSGASGTITMNGAAGVLAVRAGAASGEWASTDVDGLLANAALTFTTAGASLGIDTTGGDFSYGSAIPNKTNNGLVKLGPNTLTLTAANLYPNKTTINRGTVKLNAPAGSLASTSALTFTGAGTFNIDNTGAGSATSQSLGALTFTTGAAKLQLSSTAMSPQDSLITFSSLAPRATGASANFVQVGTPSATNGFVLTGVTANSFLNQATTFNGSAFAWNDAGGFLRAINYASDTGATTSGATGTLAAATHQQITGAISNQLTAAFTTLNISGNNNFAIDPAQTVTVNGILKSGNTAGGATISGGTAIQAASAQDLAIRTDGSNDALTISSPIATAPGVVSGSITSTTAVVTGLASTANMAVGMTVVIPGGNTRTISTINSSSQITLSGTAGGTTGTATMWIGFINNPVIKTGAGTLTLSAANNFGGGLYLNEGRLNINSATALGGGLTGSGTGVSRLTINEGTTIDNTSGATITMGVKYPMTWNGNFTFVGTNDLNFIDPGGNGNITMPNDVTVTVTNAGSTLKSASNFTLTTAKLTKNGLGTLFIGSNGGHGANGGLVINQGVLAGIATGGQPNAVFAGPVSLGDATAGNSNTAILDLVTGNNHGAPITVRAGSSGTLAIVSETSALLYGPMTLNNKLSMSTTSGTFSHYGVIGGTGALNIGTTGSFIVSGATKSLANAGTVKLFNRNTYTGNTVVNSGTLALGTLGKIDSSAQISIKAGATFDVSSVPAFSLAAANSISGSGTGTTTDTTAARIVGASGSTVSMSNRPISLDYAPTGFSGDTTHPSLLISQGNLVLSNNVISVNNTSGTPLGAGDYRLIQVTSATTTGTPASAVTVTGSGLAPYSTATASVSGGHVILTVTTKLPPTLTSLPLSQTVQLSAGTVTLSGVVSAAGPTYPADGETVQITINGVTQNATIAGGAGAFTLNYSPLPAVGLYPITYSYAGNVDLWTADDVTTSLTVTNQTVPTITTWPSGTGITYGASLSSSTLSVGSASVSGTFTFTSPTTIPPAGSYGASGTFTPDDLALYSIVTVPGAINVAVAQKSLTIDSPLVTPKSYTGTDGATITGTLNGVLPADVGLVTLVGTGNFLDVNVGTGITVTAAATLSGAQAGNYSLTQPSGLIGNITPATLTVTAKNALQAVGASDPTFTYTITGYVNGEDEFSAVLGGSALLTTTATSVSPEGAYPIDCDLNDLAAANYSFTAVDGTLYVVGSLSWRVGNGLWDFTSTNWKNSGGTPVLYADNIPLTFDNTATGGGPFTVTLNTNVNPGAMTFSTTNKNYTISGTGQIKGAASLAKSGSGSLTLETNNTFNGGVTVSAGTLFLGNMFGLGSGTLSIAAGSTFQQTNFEGNVVTGAVPNSFDLTGSGNVIFNMPFGGAKDVWLSQVVSGTGGITVQGGARALTLTNDNTFSGGVKLTNADNRVNIQHVNGLGTGTFRSERTTAASGRLESLADLSAGVGVDNAKEITPGAYLNIFADGSNHLKLSGAITSPAGVGNLYKDGSAILTLTGSNTYSGTTSVVAGKLLVNGTNSGSGAVSVSSAATFGGIGSVAGNVTYATGSFAQFTQGSPFTIGGTLTLNNNVVRVSLPTNLSAGVYTLATYTEAGSSGSVDATPVIDSGSLAPTATATVSNSAGAIVLTVVGGLGPFETWSTVTYGLSGGNEAGNADPDNDGIGNALEFVLGGNPTTPSNSILPTVDESTGDLIFTFYRKDLSEGSSTITFQWSTDLTAAGWNNVAVGAADSSAGDITVDVTEDNPDADTDKIVITVPAVHAVGGKLMGRLSVSVP